MFIAILPGVTEVANSGSARAMISGIVLIMNRFRFLSLFGLASLLKAQTAQWAQCVPDKDVYVGSGAILCTDKTKPALNGQCPVCSTMYRNGLFKSDKISSEQLVRCHRCNAAYYVDRPYAMPTGKVHEVCADWDADGNLVPRMQPCRPDEGLVVETRTPLQPHASMRPKPDTNK